MCKILGFFLGTLSKISPQYSVFVLSITALKWIVVFKKLGRLESNSNISLKNPSAHSL